MSDINVQPQHPLVELLAQRLFGITTVPAPEQRRMVQRACKAAAEYHDAEIERLRCILADLLHGLGDIGCDPSNDCWPECRETALELVKDAWERMQEFGPTAKEKP